MVLCLKRFLKFSLFFELHAEKQKVFDVIPRYCDHIIIDRVAVTRYVNDPIQGNITYPY